MTNRQKRLIENYIQLKVKKIISEGPNQDKEFYAKKVVQKQLNRWIQVLTKIKSELNEYDPMLFSSLEEIVGDIQTPFGELEEFLNSMRK